MGSHVLWAWNRKIVFHGIWNPRACLCAIIETRLVLCMTNSSCEDLTNILLSGNWFCMSKVVIHFLFNLSPNSLKGQYHEDFARVWPHWKANSDINIYESLKILVIFLFRHHTNSVKLLLSVFGHGWPRWKWITTWKRLANVFKFCACILQKSWKTYYGLLSLQKFTWYLPLGVPGAFCVWVKAFNPNFSEVLMKREENPCDTTPLNNTMFSKHLGAWRVCKVGKNVALI